MYFIKPTDAFISIRGFLHKKNAVKITALWESTFGRTSAALRLLKDSLLYVEVQILNIYKLPRKNRHPIGCLFSLGSGIRIRTSTYGVRVRCATVTQYRYLLLSFLNCERYYTMRKLKCQYIFYSEMRFNKLFLSFTKTRNSPTVTVSNKRALINA